MPSARASADSVGSTEGLHMDVHAMVWAAYLETLIAAGESLTLQEVLDLQDHRESLLIAAQRAVDVDAGELLPPWDLGPFSDD